MPLLPQECPNCGRLHPTADFHTEPGPVQRELASAMEGIERVIRCWDELDLTPLRSGVEDSLPGWFNQAMEDLRDLTPFELRSVPAVEVAPRASASELEGEIEIERPESAPALGHVPSYDAGWNAHEVGLDRKTVEVLSPDPGWAVLGWDMREMLAKRQKEEQQ